MRRYWRISGIVLLSMILAACGGTSTTTDSSGNTSDDNPSESRLAQLPEGDATNGEALFEQSIGGLASCSSCHMVNEDGVGPMMNGYAERAASRVDGQSAREYTYHSIVNPADYIVEGYRNVMSAAYGARLDDQQLADLIAYWLSFEG